VIEDLAEMVDRTLLAGLTFLDAQGDITHRTETVGVVVSVEPWVIVRRAGEEDLELPPEPEAYEHAAPGEYRLRSTGEVVVDPDFLAVWTVQAPDEEADVPGVGEGRIGS
jgi:hypothetical protein